MKTGTQRVVTRAEQAKLNGKTDAAGKGHPDELNKKELYKFKGKTGTTEAVEYSTDEKTKKTKTIVVFHTE